MRQKASLLAAALGNLDPVRQTAAPHAREKPKGDPHYAATNAPAAKKRAIGRTSPLRGRTPEGLGKFHQPRKGKYQPEPAVQELAGLAEGQSD